MSTVSGCLIVRDEESTIGRLLSELEKFCDEIIVVDTGSIDNTMEICKQFNKVKLFTKEWTYDFAAARNYSFSQATCDYIFWCDADDHLPDNLIDSILRTIQGNEMVEALQIQYQYSEGVNGSMVPRVRLMKRSLNPIWHGYIHEFIDTSKFKIVSLDESLGKIIHKHYKPHSTRNLEIYQKMLSDGISFTDRDWYYYANELKDHDQFDEAFDIYKHLVLNSKGWRVDLINAVMKSFWIKVSQKKSVSEVIDMALHVLKLGHPRADILCVIGDYFLELNNYLTAMYWYKLALNSEVPKGYESLLYLNQFHTWYPYLQLEVCYWNLGDVDASEVCSRKAYEFDKTIPAIINNLKYFDSLKNGIKQ